MHGSVGGAGTNNYVSLNESTKMTNSLNGSMIINMQDIQAAKDVTGASPHQMSGLNLISN